MDKLLEKFLNKIGLKYTDEFNDSSFLKLQSDDRANLLFGTIKSKVPYKVSMFHQLFEKIADFSELSHFSIKINYKFEEGIKDVNKFVYDYIDSTSNTTELNDFDIYKENSKHKIIFMYTNENEDDVLNQVNDFREFLEGASLDCYLELATVLKTNNVEETYSNDTIDDADIDEDEDYDDEYEQEQKHSSPFSNSKNISYQDINSSSFNDEEEDNDELISLTEMSDEEYLITHNELAKNNRKLINENVAKNRHIQELNKTFYETTIKDCLQFKKVVLKGKIFSIKETVFAKSNSRMMEVYITDYTSSIIVRFFENKKSFSPDFISTLKEGKRIYVKGQIEENTYSKSHEKYVRPSIIKIIEDEEPRKDTAEVKRVELHVHTKVSNYDGIGNIDDYCKLAKQFGMKGIAITDHASVQQFPEAQAAAKANGLKMLYGCELYMVEDKPNYIFNPSNDILMDSTYVVFDLETTGLSARYDRIIEFGAVKFYKGEPIEEKSFFINPDMKLSEKTTQITSITDSDVKKGKPIKEALKIITEFVKGSILVAHNATFDVGFLNEALKNNNMEKLNNPVIDTLPLSIYMYPDQKSHSLGALCRKLDVKYDEVSAHRANYDAQVLGNCLQIILESITKSNPKMQHKELAHLSSDKYVLYSRPTHVTAYARNSQGLKDLFELLSISSIDYVKNYARTPRSVIQRLRKNLLIGSACGNGEVFEAAITKGEEVIREKIKFYDFIEIQPYTNYSYLVNEGEIQSEDHVKLVIKDLINICLKENKLVCATGDVHYANKEDKVFRDIFIYTYGKDKTRHPLNPFKRDKLPKYENPDQHFLSTDEMLEKFSFIDDKMLIQDIVVNNTIKVMDMCDEITPMKDKLYTPKIANCKENLLDIIYTNAKRIYGDPLPEVIADRLNAELTGIGENDYYIIYYIAHKLVQIAIQEGSIVGSRGSVGSSFAATMAGITEVNPLDPHYICPKCHHLEWVDKTQYGTGYDLPNKKCPECGTMMKGDGNNIPFSTFLGFKGDKVPDIDLNFASDYQSRAHDLTKVLLGENNVFKAGTLETVADKTAIGKARGYYEYFGIDSTTIPSAEILRLATGIAGAKATTGQHPGGIIVIPDYMSVYDFTPIQYPADSPDANWKTTHLPYKTIHDNVLKLDLLGHLDPYAIRIMKDMTNVNPTEIPINDPKVISLFYSTKELKLKDNLLNEQNGALGIPEFGSSLGRRILNETQPRNFDDLVKISGLSHGTGVYQGNAQDYITSGKSTLHDVVGCREDIMYFLHDVHKIDAREAFTIMELIRKGQYTKPKNAEKKEKYDKMMRDHGVPETLIESLLKISYLFPKGHAVAYSMMAVRVAHFKLYYPLAYYATFFSIRSKHYDLTTMLAGKQAIFKEYKRLTQLKNERSWEFDDKNNNILSTLTVALEMEDRGYSFTDCDINKADALFFTVDKETNKIIPSLTAVEFLGEKQALKIVEERKKGKFITVEDFVARTKTGDSIVNELRKLGAFKGLAETNQMSLFDDF